jgi:hypothetical protein
MFSSLLRYEFTSPLFSYSFYSSTTPQKICASSALFPVIFFPQHFSSSDCGCQMKRDLSELFPYVESTLGFIDAYICKVGPEIFPLLSCIHLKKHQHLFITNSVAHLFHLANQPHEAVIKEGQK